MSDPREYFGMCIGGPRAGQLLTHSTPLYWAAQMPPTHSVPYYSQMDPNELPDDGFVTRVMYVYQPWGMGELKAGVWVLEGQTPLDTFNEILVGYAESMKQ